MKSCPKCNRTYFDETFAFCLADGSLLTASFDPEATQVLPSAIDPSPPTVHINRRVPHDELKPSNEELAQKKEQEEQHSPSEIKGLFEQFLSKYDSARQREIWSRQSQTFKRFWKEKILNPTYELIPDDTNPIIKMLDTCGGGYQDGVESVARTNWRKPQYRWGCLFEDLKSNKIIQRTVDQTFDETDDNRLIGLINSLANENKQKNYLTAKSAIAINALLFINNPSRVLKIVSLDHRFQIMRTFDLGDRRECKSYGQEIIFSNRQIIDGFKEKYGIDTEPMALTEFLYSPTCWGRTYPTHIRPMWDTHPSSKSKNS
jgi:hypothetical protein